MVCVALTPSIFSHWKLGAGADVKGGNSGIKLVSLDELELRVGRWGEEGKGAC